MESFDEICRLVLTLSQKRCLSAENISAGMDFIRNQPEWRELTSSANHKKLQEYVEYLGGLGRMNFFAQAFYSEALQQGK